MQMAYLVMEGTGKVNQVLPLPFITTRAHSMKRKGHAFFLFLNKTHNWPEERIATARLWGQEVNMIQKRRTHENTHSCF